MNPNDIITELERNNTVFQNLFTGKTKEKYLWKTSPDKWCLLEIVCHLHDEEIEDFRHRVGHLLSAPNTPPNPINPTGWVTERNYIEQNFEKKVSDFFLERKKSIDWLRSLERPNWENSFEHKTLGVLTAKHFLINWLAHDHLHIKQILKLEFDYLSQKTGNDLTYAGNW